jgi:streptogramin lyase
MRSAGTSSNVKWVSIVLHIDILSEVIRSTRAAGVLREGFVKLTMKALCVFSLLYTTTAILTAAQFSYGNSGGVVSQTASGLSMTGVVLASPAGTVTMSCPLTSIPPQYPYYEQWSCAGGTFKAQSSKGATSITGTFTSGLFNLQKQGSGNTATYYYGFYANFSGSQTINGSSAAVVGSVSETLAVLHTSLNPTTGTIQTGLIDVSQQYEPVYIADTGNNRVVQSADILGSNWSSLGKVGSGAQQFSTPWGISLDSGRKIYVSDSGNCRVVRMDNMAGTNWTTFGACGSGTGQFSSPQGLWVDSSGRIYVADTGNNRIVRMNDITGSGFVTLGTLGNRIHQFSAPSAITADSAGNIYVADSGNSRIVEMADMSGTNWRVLSFAVGYITPNGIGVDSAHRIYIADSNQSQLIRVDNISGANAIDLSINYNNYGDDPHQPTGVFVDPDGAIYLADTGNNRAQRYFDTSFNDVFLFGTVGKGIGNLSQPHGVVAVHMAKSLPVAAVMPTRLSFPVELVGVASPAESIALNNIGTAPFTITAVTSSSSEFAVTDGCPVTLAGGQNCSASVIFRPASGGAHNGTITFTLSGAASKSVPVNGSGALVTLSPSQLVMYECASGIVTVTNPLGTRTSLKSIKTSAHFTETNTCGSGLAPGASCTITVNWCSTSPISGTLTVTDVSGTAQDVSLTGE